MGRLLLTIAVTSALVACEKSAPPSEPPPGNACTMDAKVCPDGSAVGRSGPNCEFAPCPEAVACTKDAKVCPDGSSVGRTGPDCEFAKCPGE
jgi:hypothetical protein